MHIALHCESGRTVGKTVYYSEDLTALTPEDIWSGAIVSGRYGSIRNIRGSKDISMSSKGLLSMYGKATIKDTAKAIDASALVRIRNLSTMKVNGH